MGQPFFLRYVKIAIIVYPTLKRQLLAGYLDEFMWKERTGGNSTASFTEVALQYQV